MNRRSENSKARSETLDWEMRPGGMLVQKRNPDSDRSSSIKIKVKFGSNLHEIDINSQATFGELKKMVSERTGLHVEDQKLMFKGKERDSKSYMDVSGVKNNSKIVVVEDVMNQERRFIEMRKNQKMERASKSISQISLEVDNLAVQVSALESVVSKDGAVAENEILNLIELLMRQLIKLDGVVAVGDTVKLQRRMQVRRVQKYVEALDLLKAQMSTPSFCNWERPSSADPPVVVTAKWEMFDVSPVPSTSSVTGSVAKLNWEHFD